jgi:hypothetical protein
MKRFSRNANLVVSDFVCLAVVVVVSTTLPWRYEDESLNPLGPVLFSVLLIAWGTLFIWHLHQLIYGRPVSIRSGVHAGRPPMCANTCCNCGSCIRDRTDKTQLSSQRAPSEAKNT